jgi:integrase
MEQMFHRLVEHGAFIVKITIADTLNEGLTKLGISRTSFHRWRKAGTACVEMEDRDGKKVCKITILDSKGEEPMVSEQDPTIESLFGHKKHIKGWVEWRDSGLGQRIWSKTYRTKMIRFAKRYFEVSETISVEGLRKWLQECNPLQHSTRVDRHAFVSSMAKYLHQEMNELLPYEEYTKIQLLYPRKPPEYEPEQRIIYSEDLQTILDSLPSHFVGKEYHNLLLETLIILLSETGMRINELVSTPLDKYHFSESPQRAIVTVKGKGSKIRTIPFSRRAQAALKTYLKERPPESDIGTLFSAYHYHKKEYTPLKDRWLQKAFDDLSEKTNIPFSAHSFRHYRITCWANDARIPITTTQKWAGHTSLMVTQRYIHTSDDQAMAAAFA